MADIKIKYASEVDLTTTALTSLADGSAWQTDEIDNTTNLYDDALLRIKTKGQSGSPTFVEVYLFASVGDTIRTGGAGATQASFTGPVEELRFLGIVPLNSATSVTVILEGVASAFGGILPEKWGAVLKNASGLALSTTAGDHDLGYQGISYQTI